MASLACLRAAPVAGRSSTVREQRTAAALPGSRRSPALRAVQPRQRVIASVAEESERATYDQLASISCDLSSFPDCSFFRVEAIIRPWRVDSVVEGLADIGIKGFTVTPVSGVGAQGMVKERYAGTEFGSINLISKQKLEVVTVREQVDPIVQRIASHAFTGELGDGKIFIHPVADIVRIRTAETGRKAERMQGGMMDMTGDFDDIHFNIEEPPGYESSQ